MGGHARFTVEPYCIGEEEAVLEGAVARQIYKVMRLKKGDEITLLDGDGNIYHTELTIVTLVSVHARILARNSNTNEPRLRVVLASCVPKSDRFELIVQKCTELGISEIVLVQSERTIPKLDEAGEAKKLRRWRKIAAEAAEQCGRSKAPELHGVISFTELLEMAREFPLAIVAWEEESALSMREALHSHSDVDSVLLVIGPEGGLTEREVEMAKSAGAVSVSMGSRVLRTDTAAIAACGIVMYELEWSAGIRPTDIESFE